MTNHRCLPDSRIATGVHHVLELFLSAGPAVDDVADRLVALPPRSSGEHSVLARWRHLWRLPYGYIMAPTRSH